MDRGDILAKLQSAAAAEAYTIRSIAESHAHQIKSNPSLFKLISSASNLEQRYEFDDVAECSKQAIINNFLSTAGAAASTATSTPITALLQAPINASSMRRSMNDSISISRSDDAQSMLDAHSTNTKNKRKNFKPRIAHNADTISTVDTQSVSSNRNLFETNQYTLTANIANSLEASKLSSELNVTMSRAQGIHFVQLNNLFSQFS